MHAELGWVAPWDVMLLAAAMLLALLLRLRRGSAARDLRMVWFFSCGGLLAWFGLNAMHLVQALAWTEALAVLTKALLALTCMQLGVVLFFQSLMPAIGLRAPRIAQDLCFTALVLGGGLMGLSHMGMDPSRLFTTSAILTAVLAFAMQDTLGNVLGGVVLQLDNSLRVGDSVRVDDVSGTVVDIRWRHTAIETSDRELVVVPNSWLMKNRFRVLRARPDEPLIVRRTLFFNLDAQAPPARVIEVINQAVQDANLAAVSQHKAHSTVLLEVGAGFHRYALRYWLADPQSDVPTDSALRMHVLAALQRAKLALGTPLETQRWQRDSRTLAWAQEQAEARLDAVRRCALFSLMQADEQERLAQLLVPAPFAPGGVVTRQGAVADWLYLVQEGRVEVTAERNGIQTRIATLGPGDYFGEMGLLTGEVRGATVVALTAVHCFRLDKTALAGLLQEQPGIAQEIAQALQERRAGLSMVLRQAAADAADDKRGDLLTRIRSFFGLGGAN